MSTKKQNLRLGRGAYLPPEMSEFQMEPLAVMCVSSYSVQELEEGEDIFEWR